MVVKSILFVCMGNICRSPSAEAVMKKVAQDCTDLFIDSAGTIAHHAGEPADERMQRHALRRDYQLMSISRPIVDEDFHKFDMIIGMDDDNMDYLYRHAGSYKAKLFKMTDFCSVFKETSVPDPYYGGDLGFELVLDLLEDACRGLMDKVCD